MLFLYEEFLSDSRHEVAHLFRGASLHLPRGVRVGTEREACVVVTQHAADGFHIHTVLECQGRECMYSMPS